MIKKLIATFTGVSGAFGFSVEKHLNIFTSPSKEIKSFSSTSRGGGHRKFSLPHQVNVGEKTKKQRILKEKKGSLQKFWFNEWTYKSEGASFPIYLVSETGIVKKINPSLHGQKQRFMWDGVSIDKVNSWFGSRSIPFNSGESKDLQKTFEDIRILDFWGRLKKSFLSQSAEELKNLSDWFEKLPDEDKCGIIDVFMECNAFKSAIKIGENSPIKEGFRINLSKFNDLAKKIQPNQFPKFTELFGKNAVFYIGVFMGFEEKVGKILNTWVNEEIQNEISSKDQKSTESNKLNGMKLLKTIISGEKFGEGCDIYSKSEIEKEIFSECLIEKEEVLDEDPRFKGEILLNPRVLDVMKAGTIDNFEDRYVKKPAYSIPEWKQDISSKNKNWKEFPKEQQSEIEGIFKKDGKWKGIVDISCSNVTESGWWSFASIFGISPEKSGCWEFYTLFFKLFGASSPREKRLCLFEIPKVNSYIKETNLFGPFMVSNWINGNKLWMRCSIHSV
ncbi:hypothetical protein MSUIS_04910 [Mycoplasma suis KI3806]|uniref:Uncharacterized protein n=1 Tax=Mycoplasma suis (strain KI_3806) TaxID=708248 RepID=F0V1Q3_MYCS3|nr:hypothetical protein [Mycoplasma suis]CBZ40584.1 hypothetical protein MSUIS_04910 [Mycoplasma suis KI3806]